MCVDVNNVGVPEIECNPDTKVTMQSCNEEPCPLWIQEDWTGVSTLSFYHFLQNYWEDSKNHAYEIYNLLYILAYKVTSHIRWPKIAWKKSICHI